jgi:hypothetical protein
MNNDWSVEPLGRSKFVLRQRNYLGQDTYNTFDFKFERSGLLSLRVFSVSQHIHLKIDQICHSIIVLGSLAVVPTLFPIRKVTIQCTHGCSLTNAVPVNSTGSPVMACVVVTASTVPTHFTPRSKRLAVTTSNVILLRV